MQGICITPGGFGTVPSHTDCVGGRETDVASLLALHVQWRVHCPWQGPSDATSCSV